MSYEYIPNNNFNNFNLNNNNNNNSNPFDGQQQPFTNKKLINIKLTNTSDNFDLGKNRKKFFNEEKDYPKSYKEEKYLEITKNQKKYRFQQNFGKKIKESQNYKDKYANNNGEVFIDDYINKVKEIYQDKDSYYAFIEQNGAYNFAQCPFCHDPCVFYLDNILCIGKKCFRTTVGSKTFNENYTLSNFMEQYWNYYSPNHLKCNADLITLYVDMESKCAEFLCSKCQSHYLNFDDYE